MGNRTSKWNYPLYFFLIAWGAAAYGQTVTFEITSVQPNNLGGVYTNPYNALVNNTISLPAFCDDFTDNVEPPQTWTALQTNLSAFGGSDVSSVYFTGDETINGVQYTQTELYIAAAILAAESLPLYQTNSTDANDISFALWGIFDPTLLYTYQTAYCVAHPGSEGCLNSTDQAKAKDDLNAALTTAETYSTGAAYENATGNNVVIYSATTNGTSPEQDSSRPQEFVTVVPMSEAPAPAQLAAESLGLAAIVYFFRRRRVTGAVLSGRIG